MKPIAHDRKLLTALEDHLDHCFGRRPRNVLHELVSDTIHVDIHIIEPTDEFPVTRLVTSGMASRPMKVPPEYDQIPAHAELTIALPPDWPVKGPALRKPSAHWPFTLLHDLARLPHKDSTYLSDGHAVSDEDPSRAWIPGTEVSGVLIVPPEVAPDGFDEFECRDGRTVTMLGVLPVHNDEMAYAQERGQSELFDLLTRAGMTDVVDPARPSLLSSAGAL